MSGLVERLQEDHNSFWQPLMDEAADEITRLTARVAELEGALRPFAYQADTFDTDGVEFVPDEFVPAIVDHTIGDLRRARAALEPKP